jgi:hypothetical protein
MVTLRGPELADEHPWRVHVIFVVEYLAWCQHSSADRAHQQIEPVDEGEVT